MAIPNSVEVRNTQGVDESSDQLSWMNFNASLIPTSSEGTEGREARKRESIKGIGPCRTDNVRNNSIVNTISGALAPEARELSLPGYGTAIGSGIAEMIAGAEPNCQTTIKRRRQRDLIAPSFIACFSSRIIHRPEAVNDPEIDGSSAMSDVVSEWPKNKSMVDNAPRRTPLGR